MEPRQCEKCGETVEATRAFCPGCGAAMVAEEERGDVSAFEASAGTVQYGNTVFGRLLSDMGLNISDAPNKPLPPATPVTVATPLHPEPIAATAPSGSSKAKWIVIAVAAFVFLGMLAVIVAAVLLYIFSGFPQFTT